MRYCQRESYRDRRINRIAAGFEHRDAHIGRMCLASGDHSVPGPNRLSCTQSRSRGRERCRQHRNFSHKS